MVRRAFSRLLLAVVFGATVAFAVAGCGREILSARLITAATYRSESGEEITARYYQLEDGSLSFVVLELPDDEVRTLPQLVSASGARYTDERDYQWWIIGDTARLDRRAESGDWVTRYTLAVE